MPNPSTPKSIRASKASSPQREDEETPAAPPNISKSSYYILSLSPHIRSHAAAPSDTLTALQAEKDKISRERAVARLPRQMHSWVVVALRKKSSTLRLVWDRWMDFAGVDPSVPLPILKHILSKAQRSEDDYEVISKYVRQNDVMGGMYTALSALKSRSEYLSALKKLQMKEFKSNTVLILQNEVPPAHSYVHAIVKGTVNCIELPTVMFESDGIKTLYNTEELYPTAPVSIVQEMLTAGDVTPLSDPCTVGGHGNPSACMIVSATPLITLTLPPSTYRHAVLSSTKARDLRTRITFLKQSHLFPLYSHSAIVDLAGMLEKWNYEKNDIICKQGKPGTHFYFILTGEILVQYFPPTGPLPSGDDVLRPTHDWNITLRHGSILAEDVLVGSPLYDTTAVAQTPVTLFAVPQAAFKHFKPLLKSERVLALVHAKSSVTLPTPTLHARFTSVRSVVAQTRPHRGVINLHEYNNAEHIRAASSEDMANAGASSPTPTAPIASPISSPRKRLLARSTTGLSTRSMYSSVHSDEMSMASDGPTAANQLPQHEKLDQRAIEHLGEAARAARNLVIDQKRSSSRAEAAAKISQFRTKLQKDFDIANAIATLDLQKINEHRRLEAREFLRAMEEVRAALIMAAAGAISLDADEKDIDADLKLVVGEILFGKETGTGDHKQELRKLENSTKEVMNANRVASYSVTDFKRKAEEVEMAKDKKSWSAKVNKERAIKKRRDKNIKALRDLMKKCDDATLEANTFDYTMMREEMMERYGDLIEKARAKVSQTYGKIAERSPKPMKRSTFVKNTRASLRRRSSSEDQREAENSEGKPSIGLPDPKAALQKKAKKGWGNLRQVATTHLDKRKGEDTSEGVKKMLMSTVRVVGETEVRKDDDPLQRLLETEKRERELVRQARISRKRENLPNATYFKAAGICDTRENLFLNFDDVLALKSEDTLGMTVSPRSVLKDSMARIKEARIGGNITGVSETLRSVRSYVKSNESKKLNDTEEWQIFHIEQCFTYKTRQKSLPNLNGVKGKCRLSTRSPPHFVDIK